MQILGSLLRTKSWLKINKSVLESLSGSFDSNISHYTIFWEQSSDVVFNPSLSESSYIKSSLIELGFRVWGNKLLFLNWLFWWQVLLKILSNWWYDILFSLWVHFFRRISVFLELLTHIRFVLNCLLLANLNNLLQISASFWLFQ